MQSDSLITFAGLMPVSLPSRPWYLHGEAVVVEAEQVQHGGVEVADVDRDP